MQGPLTIYTNDWDRAELIWQNRHLEMELAGASSLNLITCIKGVEMTYSVKRRQPDSSQKQLEIFGQPS